MSLELLQQRRVAASILAADLARLGEQVGEVIDAGARVIHVDVMDGHFVPPIATGAGVVAGLRELTATAGAIIEVHLMVERPERQVEAYARAGADLISFHAEATPHVHYTVSAIREAGAAAGVAICPATPVRVLAEVAGDLDLALCMTVDPGWGGQTFIPTSIDKVRRLRALVGAGIALEVDGGIDPDTAPAVAQAGATVFVAGSAIFGAPDPGTAYREIAAAAEAV